MIQRLIASAGFAALNAGDRAASRPVIKTTAAAAERRIRIRLRTMLKPAPGRRPWELASQTATLDNLSGGRVILPVGLGVTGEDRFWLFEEAPGRRVRRDHGRIDAR